MTLRNTYFDEKFYEILGEISNESLAGLFQGLKNNLDVSRVDRLCVRERMTTVYLPSESIFARLEKIVRIHREKKKMKRKGAGTRTIAVTALERSVHNARVACHRGTSTLVRSTFASGGLIHSDGFYTANRIKPIA